jgi:FkbM family methyltransferase
LRRYYSNIYHGKANRWAIINDYRRGLRFKVDRAAYMGSAIYWQGWHHLEELKYIEQELRGDETFIDAGANTGEFTISVAGRLPAGLVLAFEPQPDMYKTLAENVRINNFHNVRLICEGLSDREGEVPLYTSNDRKRFDGVHEGLFTQFPDEWRADPAGTMRLRTLDSVLEEQGIAKVDWLKVDVEGGELPLLRGASRMLATNRPRLLVEVNEPTFRSAGYCGADLEDFLRGFGYLSYRLQRNGLIPIQIRSIGDRPCNVLFLSESEMNPPVQEQKASSKELP